MTRSSPHSIDELLDGETWPLSRLFHENSKLGPLSQLEFVENISSFEQDVAGVRTATQSAKPYPTRRKIDLPRDRRVWRGRRLRDVLRRRRSHRGPFAERQVTLRQWGSLLELACGLTGQARHPDFPEIAQELRAWPSAGALFPIETYVAVLRSDALDRAFCHYQPLTHQFTQLGDCPDAKQLEQMVFADGLWLYASGLVVLTAVLARTQRKYGERGYRFALLEAGHVAQNILLACEDLGLAATPLGGFHEDALADYLELDGTSETPIYAILIGSRDR